MALVKSYSEIERFLSLMSLQLGSINYWYCGLFCLALWKSVKGQTLYLRCPWVVLGGNGLAEREHGCEHRCAAAAHEDWQTTGQKSFAQGLWLVDWEVCDDV